MPIFKTIKFQDTAKVFALGALVLMCLMLLMTFASVYQVSKIAEQTNKIHRHPLVVSNAIQSAETSIISMHRYMKDVSLARTQKDLDKAVGYVKKEEMNVLQQFEIVEQRFLGDINRIINLKQQFLAWRDIRNRVIHLSEHKKYAEAAAITKGEGFRYVNNLINGMEGIVDFARNKASEFLNNAEQKSNQSQQYFILLGLIVLLLGITISLFVILRVKSIQQQLIDSETKFRSAFDNIALANIVINDHAIVEVFNPAAEIMFGYNSSEVVGKNVRMLMPLKYKEKHDFYIQRFLETGEKNVIGNTREVTALKKNGDEFPIQLNVAENNINDKVSFVGTIRDISDVKKLEAKLTQKHRFEAVGQLTGGIAHDFNNLLAIMLGNLELAVDNIDKTNNSYKYLQTSIESIEKASLLTQQLLSYSGQLNLRPVNISSNKLINDSVQFLRRTFSEKINFIVNPSNKDFNVYVDPGMFSNVLINLALNSRDAMPDGGDFAIDFEVISIDSPVAAGVDTIDTGEYVLFKINDTGCGISEEQLNKVFEPFFTTKEFGHGSGLGLSMVYGFIRQSKGYIKFESKINIGTTVLIYLPVSSENKLDTPSGLKVYSGNDNSSNAVIHQAELKVVLLVEDDELVAEATSNNLKELGFNVLTANDAVSALERLDANYVDLLITDIIMPGNMNGTELAKRAKEKNTDLNILLISGYPEDEIKEDVNNKFKLLAKPFSRNDLSVAISQVLSSS